MGTLFLGHLAFGVATGLLTGMSKSPVVSVILPLMFTFAGGSVLALTTVAGLTADDKVLLGLELLAFAIGMIGGVFLGKEAGELPFKRT